MDYKRQLMAGWGGVEMKLRTILGISFLLLVSVVAGCGGGSNGGGSNADVPSFRPPLIFAVGMNPHSLSIGDFNADSKQDLAVANANSDNISILLGDGTGSFSPATNFAVGTRPFSVSIGDFNSDGKPDIVTANDGAGTISILLSQ